VGYPSSSSAAGIIDIEVKSDGQKCPSYLFLRARFGRDQSGQAVVDDELTVVFA
jgi:hypothetical protein